MNNYFSGAHWIWRDGVTGANDYAEFCDSFVYDGGDAVIRISVCGDYTLYVNGTYVDANQYGDFEHFKVYDEIDITPYVKAGENRVAILGWYFGVSGMRYSTPAPGLIYEVEVDGSVAAVSNSDTMSRQSRVYHSGEFRKISMQIGYSFCYDANLQDGWIAGELDCFSPSAEFSRKPKIHKRPCHKLRLGEPVYGTVSKTENSYIIDLGEEYVGLVSLDFASETGQKITVAYGEVLENGHTKRKIGARDFSFDYVATAGDNSYVNYMLRLACRYIEIFAEEPIDIHKVGIIPQYYPAKVKDVVLDNELDRRIYDICVNTLNLCMMEHYVDCPWREQCLYAFDSRNQMLAGYSAYEDSNFEYVRANLLLMSKDIRDDKLLSICFPSADDLVIPSFSLYYLLGVKEYIDYSGDLTLGEEVFVKLESILSAFVENIRDGLVYKFPGTNHWSFYDWTDYGYSGLWVKNEGCDFLLNAIFVLALNSFDDICAKLGRDNKYAGLAKDISAKAKERFFNKESGFYFIENIDERPTELANSLAVLTGIADEDEKVHIVDALAKGELMDCSLSMKVMKYDAMLSADEKYIDVVFAEIRETYKKMLDAGSTTVWETIDGADAFEKAGSLCHGWSSVPVHYYNKYLAK